MSLYYTSLNRPDAEASQSDAAAQRDDSLATNPSAGLVIESHPPTRRRRGLVRMFAAVACLAWLASPTAAFAQNSLDVNPIAGNDKVTASEKSDGFTISGNTSTVSGGFSTPVSGINVTVTIGTGSLTGTSNAEGNWSVNVLANASYITDGTNQPATVAANFIGQTVTHTKYFDVDLTLPLVVDAVAGDDKINIAEKANGFTISGDTNTIRGVAVTVTIGTGSLTGTSNAEGNWSVNVLANTSYITEMSVSLSVTATKNGFTDATVPRMLPVDLTAPTVNYTAPSSLKVGVAITSITPTTSDMDIVSYAISSGSLPPGLALNDAGVISGAPTTANTNTRMVGVLATDDAGNKTEVTITFPAVAQRSGVTVSPQILSVPEGGSAYYTLELDSLPTDNVTITVSLTDFSDEDLTASPESLTFKVSNWNTPQTVTISSIEDADGTHGIASIKHTAESIDSSYDAIGIAAVRATEADNDPIGVTVSPTRLWVPDGRSREYTVVLDTQPASDVEISVDPDQGNDADLTVTPTVLTFTDSDWSMAQTVTVSAALDIDQVNGIAIFSHSSFSFDEDYDDIAIAPLTVTENEIRPRVKIQTEASATVGGAFEVTIRFSERIEGFELEDIEVSNGTASNFNTVYPQAYTVRITPEATGEVRVEVRSDVARSAAGNGNWAAKPLVIEADLEHPEVTIEGPTEPVGAGFEVTITFSEAVTGFEQSEITVTNGRVSSFSEEGSSYTAEITPSASGAVTVEVGAGVAEDATGNGNRASEPLVIEVDMERPAVTIEGPTEPAEMARFEVTIAFSEPVEGFELEDIRVTNGTASNFIKISPQEYTATITPERIGEVRVEVLEDVVSNGNQAADAFEVETKLAVSYQEESYTAREGGETVTVTVKLSQGWDEDLAIPIRVTRPETTEVADYILDGLGEWNAQEGTGRLTFPAEETEQTFTIEANHDGDGDDETVELEFGELPEILLAGKPGVATVTLEDKGLVELKLSFGQAEYQIREGQQVDIEVTVSPAADWRVEVPLVVVLQGGATDEDYSGVPASLVFEKGESQGAISLAVLADKVNDPGEGIGLSFGELPKVVIPGDPASTQVLFTQRRTAEQFSQTLEVSLAVLARSTAASAQSAIQGRFERHRQWSRMASNGATQGTGTSEAAGATEPTQGSWLRSFSLGGLGSVARSGQSHLGASPSYDTDLRGSVYGQDRLHGSGTRYSLLGSESTELSGMGEQKLSLAGTSFELSLGEQEKGKSWVPVLWGQGDLQYFNGDLRRLGMNYHGGLDAAHVGLDLYANEKMLAGLSFMRSWGDMDYTDDGVDGVLESGMNTFHPYLYWQPKERVSVWGIGGLGAGQVEVREPDRTHNFDADFKMFSGGVRAVLTQRDYNELGLRADAFTAQLETDASEDITTVSGEAHRARLMLEWVYDRALSTGRLLSLKVEAGGRLDGGDADRGSGLETGFQLGFLDANKGLDVALHGRALVVHESDYQDWGVGVQASWDPGEKQRGFRVSVTSSWGRDGQGRTTLWDNADAVMRPLGMRVMGMSSQYRMESEVAYGGLNAPGVPGLLTPYCRLRWAGQGRELALGTAWSLSAALPAMLKLEAMRRESATGPADLGMSLRVSIPLDGSRDVIPGRGHPIRN